MNASSKARSNIVRTYRERARHYDITANLYYLFGFREWAYHRLAVQQLQLHPGDSVVEIGCGTGLNFGLLERVVGPSGRIIGVDLTDMMLAQAQRRIREHNWTNISLVQADALAYEFPGGVDGIFSTFAVSLVPDCGTVIAHGCAALAAGRRWVVLDLKLPDWAPGWLVPLLLPIVRPFAVDEETIARRPWDTIWLTMQEYLSDVSWTERYFGFAYLAAGARAPSQAA